MLFKKQVAKQLWKQVMKTYNKPLAVTGGLLLASSLLATPAWAQAGGVYRCGNEYTNNKVRIEQGGCVPLTGGRLTIVRGGPIRTASISRSSSGARRASTATPSYSPGSGTSVTDSAQRARDASARNILQTELNKASQKLAELQKEYNNGNPEKIGPEHRNHQKYLDRVAELKSSIARTESDIAGIRRELGRSGG